MHSAPHAHNLHLFHSLLASVYGHGLWRIDFAAVFKCFYLFGLRRPHELSQWNRCVKRERSAAGCVCVRAPRETLSFVMLSLSRSVFCFSPGLFLSRPRSCFPAIVYSSLMLSSVLCVSHSLSLSLFTVWFGLFVYEVRNAIWLVSYKTRVERAHGCKTNLLFAFMTIKFKWTPLTTRQHSCTALLSAAHVGSMSTHMSDWFSSESLNFQLPSWGSVIEWHFKSDLCGNSQLIHWEK